MEFKKVNPASIGKLKDLAPMRFLERIKERGVNALAVIDREPIGLMICQDGSIEQPAELLWIRVEEKYRILGIGEKLMQAFFDRFSESVSSEAQVYIPEGEDYIGLQLFLNRFCFRFDTTLSFEIYRTLKELESAGMPAVKGPQAGCVAAAEVKEGEILEYLESCADKEGAKRVRKSLSSIDWDVSCVLLRDKRITGLLAVHSYEDAPLEPLLLEAATDADRLKLAKSSFMLALDEYGEKQPVYICCRRGETGRLLDLMFPQLHPLRVRRGIFRVNPKRKEEV